MITNLFIDKINKQTDVKAKALAYFLFREIIEDAHAKYNISQDDIQTMCKVAVDRAAAFLKIQKNSDAYYAFNLNAIYTTEWDDADESNIQEIYNAYCHFCDF